MFLKSQPVDFIVAGLGNPGDKYRGTRHNTGFDALDYIAGQAGVKLDKKKFSALYGIWQTEGKKVMLMKPQTFMNLSGDAVGAAARFYKIPRENVIIIYDDVSLAPGRMRIRTKGSAGGHNGIKSIIAHIGDNFPRIKIGVGEKPTPDYDLISWVMGRPGADDRLLLQEKYESAYQALKLIIKGDTARAMNLYNR